MLDMNVGDLLELRAQPCEVIAAAEGRLTLCPLDGDDNIIISMNEIEAAYAAQELRLYGQNTEDGVDENLAFLLLPDHVREEAHRREAYVREMHDQRNAEGEIPNAALVALISKVHIELQTQTERRSWKKVPGRSTVRRWYRAWEERGRTVHALAPGYENRGSADHRLHPLVERLIQEVIDEVWLTRQRPSTTSAYNTLESRLAKLNESRPPGDQLEVPHRRTFKRRLKEVDPYLRDLKRHGRDYADNAQKTVRRDHRRATRPNEIWQVDATPVDARLFDGLLPTARLERPFLTVVIDQFTRCVMGYYLSFGKPSTTSIAGALRMAMRSKTEILEANPLVTGDWPCTGVCSVLICDNGRENHSVAFRDLCGLLGTELLYVPRKKPRNKPHVERFFRTLNAASHRLPGTTFSNPQERGSYDSDKHAGLTLDDFREWLEHFIVDRYHQDYHSAIRKSPIRMWQESVATDRIRMPEAFVDEEAFFMKENSRVLQKDGIHLDYLIYSAPELQDIYDHRKKARVTFRYSDDYVDTILIKDPARERWIRAYCDTMQTYAEGRSRKSHRAIVRNAQAEGRGAIDNIAIAKASVSVDEEMDRRAARQRRAINAARRKVADRPADAAAEPPQPNSTNERSWDADDDESALPAVAQRQRRDPSAGTWGVSADLPGRLKR